MCTTIGLIVKYAYYFFVEKMCKFQNIIHVNTNDGGHHPSASRSLKAPLTFAYGLSELEQLGDCLQHDHRHKQMPFAVLAQY